MPGVNRLDSYGRWAFAEFTDVYTILDGLDAVIEAHTQKQFGDMIEARAPARREGAAT